MWRKLRENSSKVLAILILHSVLVPMAGACEPPCTPIDIWIESEPSASEQYCGAPMSGNVCAEWTNFYGVIDICCIPSAAVGTSDPGQCVDFIRRVEVANGDRDVID